MDSGKKQALVETPKTNLKTQEILESPLYLDFIISLDTYQNSSESTLKLNDNLKKKLQVLSRSIFNKIDEQNNLQIDDLGSDLNEAQEFKTLKSMPLEAQMKLYVDIVTNFIPSRKKSMITSFVKKGQLYLRSSGALKSWKLRWLLLKHANKTLTICKETTKDIYKELGLHDCDCKWIGEKKSKFSFSIDIKTGKKVNSHLFASDQEHTAKDWYMAITSVIKAEETTEIIPQDKRANFIEQTLHTERKRFADEMIQYKKEIEVKKSFGEDKRSLVEEKGPKKKALSDYEDKSEPEDSPNKKKDDLAGNQEKEKILAMSAHSIPNNLLVKPEKEAENEKEDTEETQAAKPKKKSSFMNRPTVMGIMSPRNQESQDQKLIDSEKGDFFGGRQSLPANRESILEKNPKDYSFINNSSSFGVPQDQGGSLVFNSRPTLFTSVYFNQRPSIEPRGSVKNKPVSKPPVPRKLTNDNFPPIMEEMLKNLDWKEINNEDSYGLRFAERNLRILQHKTKPEKYKLFLTLPFASELVMNTLLDIDKWRNWNSKITNLQIMSIIEEKNCAVLCEERVRAGMLYKARDFVFLRFPVKINEIFYILDKSVEPKNNITSRKVNGSLSSVIMVLDHPSMPNLTLLALSAEISNGGYVNQEQDRELTLQYLKEYNNLELFLLQKSFFPSEPKKLPLTIYEEEDVPNPSPVEFIQEPLKQYAAPNSMSFSRDEVSTQLSNTLYELHPREFEEKERVDREISFSKGTNIFSDSNENIKKSEMLVEQYIDLDEERKNDTIEELDESRSKIPQQTEQEISIPMSKTQEATDLKLPENSELEDLLSSMKFNEIKQIIEVINGKKVIEYCIKSYFHMGKHPFSPVNVQKISPKTGHYALNNDWQRSKEGGLLYKNKEHLEEQKNVVSYLIKKMGSNLLSGKSVMSISLPINIFDEKSILDRMAYTFTYAPYFLDKAGLANDKLAQFKQVILFCISMLHLGVEQRKPFNPILGETFQARINGYPIYMEQISHHPPISSFYYAGPNYKIQGNFEVTASLHANSVTGKQLGVGQVVFSNTGSRICFTTPPCHITGTSFGQRIVNYEGKSFVYDIDNGIFCELTFNPDKKGIIGGIFAKNQTAQDFFSGGIYEIKENVKRKLSLNAKMNKFAGLNLKEDITTKYSAIQGVWHEYCEIDGERLWKFQDYLAYELQPESNPLPSDTRYREDLILWKTKNLKPAQESKDRLENIQRADKKLRGKTGKKGH